jgi:hypothetical protein
MSSETLMQEFDRLLEEKTFSVEAAAGIAALKQKFEETARSLDLVTGDRDSYRQQFNTERDKVCRLEEKLENQAAKLDAALARVDKMAPAQLEADKERAVSEAYRFCFETVFKPVTLRRSVQGNVVMPPAQPMGPNGVYPPQAYISQTPTVTTEAEE